MSAGVYSLYIEQGARKSFNIAYKDSAGEPVDLTGYSGRGSIRLKATDESPIATFDVTIPDPTNGIINVELAADALEGSADIKGRSYSERTKAVYDIEIYTALDADVIRIRVHLF